MGRGFASLLVLSLLAGLALRLVPFSLPSFTDPDHYYHLRISESIVATGEFPSYDALSFQGRPHTYYPLFHCIIASVAVLAGLPAFYAYAAVSLLCALAAIAATYALARRIFGPAIALYACAFASLLPAVLIRGAGLARPDSLSFLLLPVLAMALLSGTRRAMAVTALLGFILPLLHPFTALFACALVGAKLAADFSLGRLNLPGAAWFFAPALAGFSYYLRFPLGQLALASTFATSSEMQAFNFEFIAVAIGAAWLFLAFAALRPGTESGRRMLWLWLSGATALSLLASRNVIYAAAPACVLAGAGLNHILSRGIARPLVLCLLGAGLLLGSVLYLSDAGPQYSKQAVFGARWLGANSASGAVASYWDKGHLLTYYGSRVFIDGYFEFAPGLDARHSLSMRLFYAPDSGALSVLYAQGVRYAFVDGKMAADMERDSSPFAAFCQKSQAVSRAYDSGLAQAYSFPG